MIDPAMLIATMEAERRWMKDGKKGILTKMREKDSSIIRIQEAEK